MVANLGPENQKESQEDLRHDRKKLRVPLRQLRQKLRLRCVPQPPHEAQTQLRHQDRTVDSRSGGMSG